MLQLLTAPAGFNQLKGTASGPEPSNRPYHRLTVGYWIEESLAGRAE